MMDTAKCLQDFFIDGEKCPGMASLKPKMNLVGSIPEGTRAGEVREIDLMMDLTGFKQNFLAPTKSASTLLLNNKGNDFFGKFLRKLYYFSSKK